MKKKWFYLSLFVLMIVVGAGGLLFVNGYSEKNSRLTQDEVYKKIETMYAGTIETIQREDGIFRAQITRSNGFYEAKIDATNGKVYALKRLEKLESEASTWLTEEEVRAIIEKTYGEDVMQITFNETESGPIFNVNLSENEESLTVSVDAKSGKVLEENQPSSNENEPLIAENDAIQLALEQIPGKTEKTTFTDDPNGGYYLIDIKQADGTVAALQIHAITGEILSIKFGE